MHVHVQVLRGETAKCRYMVCNYHTLTGRKRDRLLDSTALDVPNPKCGVCLPSMCLVVDTTAFTVGDLIDAVVTKRLGFSRRAARHHALLKTNNARRVHIANGAVTKHFFRRHALNNGEVFFTNIFAFKRDPQTSVCR